MKRHCTRVSVPDLNTLLFIYRIPTEIKAAFENRMEMQREKMEPRHRTRINTCRKEQRESAQ